MIGKPTSRMRTMTGLVMALILACSLGAHGAGSAGKPAGEKRFTFPDDIPAGVLYTRPSGAEARTPWTLLGPAREEVTVPAGMELRLLLTPGQGDLALLLAQFAPNDLTELDCSRTEISDPLMPVVGRLTGLRFLELESTQVTDEGLKYLGGLQNLEGLSVRNCPIKGPGMAALAGLEKLKALRFAIIKKSDDDVLKYLAGFKHLEVLDIKELNVEGNNHALMENLPELPTVKELDLSEHPNLKDEDLVYLKRLPNLERLRFARTGLKGPGLQYLEPLQKLETLIIERTPVNGPGLKSLAQLPRLANLVLRAAMVNDLAMDKIGAIKSLKSLDLTAAWINDQGLSQLEGLTNLEELNVTGTSVSDAGIERLTQKLPGLKRLVCQVDGVKDRFRLPLDPKRSKIKVGLVIDYQKDDARFKDYGKPRWGGWVISDLGFDLYGIVDPGTRDQKEMEKVKHQLGVSNRLIEANDVAELSKLDVIALWMPYYMPEETVKGIVAAVENGVGLLTNCSVGGHDPGFENAALQKMMGVRNPKYYWHGNFMPFECTVVASHPILGGLQPGNSVIIDTIDAHAGENEGTALLAGSPDIPATAVPLYVRQLGKGRCVHYQSFDFSRHDLICTPREFFYDRRDWMLDMWGRAMEWTARSANNQ